MSTHERSKLLTDTLQDTETVVLSQSDKKVLEDVRLVSAGDFLQLRDDGLLVCVGEGGGAEDGGQLFVGLEGFAEVGDCFGGLVEGGGFGGGGVLMVI